MPNNHPTRGNAEIRDNPAGVAGRSGQHGHVGDRDGDRRGDRHDPWASPVYWTCILTGLQVLAM